MKTSRLYAVVLLLALFASHPLAAQQISKSPLHALWKVEGKSNVVYLLGSIHLLRREHHPLAPAIQSAYSNATVLAFETDIEEMEKPETQAKMLAKSMLSEGETLKTQLSAQTYSDLIKRTDALGLPTELVDRMKPSIAAMTIALIEIQKLGANPNYGVDRYFHRRARSEGKEVIGLETVDFQIDLITTFSRAEGELLLTCTLKDLDTAKVLYGDMVTAWQTGDTARLEDLLDRAFRQAPALYKRMVTDRTRQWMTKTEELLRDKKNAVIIVGVGHLVHNDGLVGLLKKKGYKVTQL